MKILASLNFIAAALIPATGVAQVCTKEVSVPEYPVIAVAAHSTGIVDLEVTVGRDGKVIDVEAQGASPILTDQSKNNVKGWLFCDPKKSGTTRAHLRFDYRLEGAPAYPYNSPASVVIDLESGTVVIKIAAWEDDRGSSARFALI